MAIILAEPGLFQVFVLFWFCLAFILIPHPAEYGTEEFSLDAVPMLRMVRIGFGRGGCESTETCSFTIRINPVVHANGVLL